MICKNELLETSKSVTIELMKIVTITNALGKVVNLLKPGGLNQILITMALNIGEVEVLIGTIVTQYHHQVDGLRETFGITVIEKSHGAKNEAFGRMVNGSHLKFPT